MDNDRGDYGTDELIDNSVESRGGKDGFLSFWFFMV